MNRKAVAAVLAAGVLWGIISLFIRGLAAAGLDTLQIGCVRILVATAVFFAFTAISKPKELRIRPKDIWCFAGTGIVSIVIFNLLYFYTIVHSQASVAVVLLYTSPVFVMVMSAILFRERISPVKLAALVLTVAGCAGVAGIGTGEATRVTPLILLTGIGSGFFYALYTIFARYALKRYSSMTATLWTFLVACIGVIPTGNLPATVQTIASKPETLLLILGLAVCSTAMPYFLYTWGLNHMESGKAAIIVAVEPLVGTMIGTLIYGEPMTLLKGCGILLILVSIFLLNMRNQPKGSEP